VCDLIVTSYDGCPAFIRHFLRRLPRFYLGALHRQVDNPVAGTLKIRDHDLRTGRSVIQILETTNFLWLTVSARMGVLVGMSILARNTIVRVRITARTNGSKAHGHSLSIFGRTPFPVPEGRTLEEKRSLGKAEYGADESFRAGQEPVVVPAEACGP
jgi:hypothetical protein